MRASSAFGGFLLIAGLITLILKPVYDAGPLPQSPGVEASGPLRDIRPVPPVAAILAVGSGLLLLGFSWRTRGR